MTAKRTCLTSQVTADEPIGRPILRPLTVMIAFLMSVAAVMLFAQPSSAAVVNGGTLSAGVPVKGKVAVAPRACDLTPNVTGTWKITLDPGDNSVGSMTMARR